MTEKQLIEYYKRAMESYKKDFGENQEKVRIYKLTIDFLEDHYQKRKPTMTIDFELIDKYTPDVVIKKSLEQIEQATKGHVIGNITRYDGPGHSHTKGTEHAGALWAMEPYTETVTEDLGEQNKFEVFLTVKGLRYYKYRMMFVEYSAISYPVTIVMNEDLAIEYSGKKKDIFTIASMKKLEELIDAVINSETMTLLIQKLYKAEI